ncbi:ABC transporter ATP-binding protein, partial [Candidatus Bathyarchaeota archaeon]|nr:ABC transporter ATP-binding protein [Candidatus Bathyarchaeota archaeon]
RVKLFEAIVRVQDLKKTFRTSGSILQTIIGKGEQIRAVDDVSLDIMKGEVLGLVGESGSGKTTLGRLLLRLEEPDSGKIYFEGADFTAVKEQSRIREFRRRMQMIFQDPYDSINPRMRVREIVGEPLRVHGRGLNERDRFERIIEILEDVKLTPAKNYVDRYPHELSGGQRQRVAIARTLIIRPSFIVADEPVSMLDVSIRADLLNLMLDLKDRYNLTYLFITHDLAVAKYICDRIAVMRLGKIVELGPTLEVVNNPRHPYTKALRAAVPRLKPRA